MRIEDMVESKEESKKAEIERKQENRNFIKSIQVIPMTRDSKFEDTKNDFEVFGITTEFNTWFEGLNTDNTITLGFGCDPFNAECLSFARKQQAFMTGPVSVFGGQVYEARTIRTESLDGFIQGPLYRVYKTHESDTSKAKTVEGDYLNKETFLMEKGLGYPTKPVFVIRYGIVREGQ